MTGRTAVDERAPGAGLAAAFHRYWYPLMALVRRDVKKRYAASMLGGFWTVLQPLLLLGIYVFVFGFIMQAGRAGEDARVFVIYILSGMLPWLAINEGVHRASQSLREDRALLERETFPGEVLPAGRVITASVSEAVGLVLLVGLALLQGRSPGAWLLALPLLVMVRLALTLGLAWGVSILAVFVTDLSEVLSLLLMALLFLTPIFYPIESVPAVLRHLIVLNPLYHLVTAYQQVIVHGASPFPAAFYALAWAAVLCAAGLWLFRKALDRGKDFL